MTPDENVAICRTMILVNDAAWEGRISAEKAYLVNDVLSRLTDEVPTGGHAMTSVDIDQNGVSVR